MIPSAHCIVHIDTGHKCQYPCLVITKYRSNNNIELTTKKVHKVYTFIKFSLSNKCNLSFHAFHVTKDFGSKSITVITIGIAVLLTDQSFNNHVLCREKKEAGSRLPRSIHHITATERQTQQKASGIPVQRCSS